MLVPLKTAAEVLVCGDVLSNWSGGASHGQVWGQKCTFSVLKQQSWMHFCLELC